MTAKSKPNGSVRRRNIYRDANSSPQKKNLNTNYVIQEILTASR
jgi:hypothetical protein